MSETLQKLLEYNIGDREQPHKAHIFSGIGEEKLFW